MDQIRANIWKKNAINHTNLYGTLETAVKATCKLADEKGICRQTTTVYPVQAMQTKNPMVEGIYELKKNPADEEACATAATPSTPQSSDNLQEAISAVWTKSLREIVIV